MASEFPADPTPPQPPAPPTPPPPPPPPGLPPAANSMIERIKRLLMSPRTEWPAIEAEPMTAQSVMLTWVLPLAAIGPIATVIRNLLFPVTIPFTTISFRVPLVGSIVQAALAVGLTMLGVWLWSLVLDALAPNFKGTRNAIAALKLVAFSATAAWICGIFQLTWVTSPLAILGLYSAYLFWVGVPVMMKVPDDQRPVYVLVAVVVGIVVNLVAVGLAGALAGMMFAMSPAAGVTTPGGSVTIGGTTIDTGKLEAQAAGIKAASEKIQAGLAGGGPKAVDPATLQNLLPASISGWNRTSVRSEGVGAGGVNGSHATAEFQSGDQRFSLSVTDLGVVGNLATLGGAITTSSNEQTATGYKKAEMKDGSMVSEEWDGQAKSGGYSVMVASRFVVEAKGSAPGIDMLKSAVAAVDLGKVQALAK